MASERRVTRQVPLATPFGRLAHERGESRGVLLSAAVHVAVIAALLWGGSLVMADRAPGPGHGPGLGGGGGGGHAVVLYVAPPPPAAPAPPPPTPVKVQQLDVVVPIPHLSLPDTLPHPAPPVRLAAAATADAGAGAGAGAGQGAGRGPGQGSGSGGGRGSGIGSGVGSDSGGGGRFYPPMPQTVLVPPQHVPGSLRGDTITAVFEISATGEILRITLHPMPRDRRFAQEFIAKLRQYAWSPARTLDGRPIAAQVPVVFTLY